MTAVAVVAAVVVVVVVAAVAACGGGGGDGGGVWGLGGIIGPHPPCFLFPFVVRSALCFTVR